MSLDKSSASVQRMFSDIAWRYDLLNHLLSANQDVLWRRRAVRRLCPRRGENVLDLCCGTGDMTLELLRQQPACRVTGADFAFPMLTIAQGKSQKVQAAGTGSTSGDSRPSFAAADALHLPFADGYFDCVTVAFGVRNFEDTQAGMEEIARVLRHGGRLMVLEFMASPSPAVRKFFSLFNVAFAPVGRALSGHESAYNYLPASIEGFYTSEDYAALLRRSGFTNVRWFHHSGGIATSFLAARS